MNRRQEIREAIKTALLGLTEADLRVFAGRRANRIQQKELPCIIINDDTETVERVSGQGAIVRTVPITIEARGIYDADSIDDSLDSFAGDIEGAIAEWRAPDFMRSVMPTTTEKAVNSESEHALGAIRLTYEIRYLTESERK